MQILIEIGADINMGKPKELLICLAVQSRNKQMVEFLLDHGISNANIRAALAISWENKLDYITGLLLEHIAVDRSRDLVTLSGLELATLKPLWILPSLGVKLKLGGKVKMRHKKEGSLGHVKENILRRKSSASEFPVLEGECWTPLKHPSSVYSAGGCRRSSIDFTALKFLPDIKGKRVGVDEPDGGSHTPLSFGDSAGDANTVNQSEWSALQRLKLNGRGSDGCDSGVHSRTTKFSLDLNSTMTLSPLLCEVNARVMSRTSFRKQAQGAISGAKSLPRSRLDQYAMDYTDGASAHNLGGSHNLGDFSLSPAQLCRQLRRVHKNRSQSVVMESRNSLLSSLSSEQFLPAGAWQRSRLEEEASPSLSECTSLSISTPSSADSPAPCEAAALEASVDGAFGAIPSESAVEVPPSGSLSSPGASTGVLVAKSRPKKLNLGLVAKPILEQEEPVSKQNSENLIKVLDLSSNHLQNFCDLNCLPYGGETLFKQLRGVRRLDVQQNMLSELPVDMMKVSEIELLLLLINLNIAVGCCCRRWRI